MMAPTPTSKFAPHYVRLAAMLAVSFVAMYGLMYAMVDRLSNVYNSLNQVYMALLMTAVMLCIEIGLMYPMYPRKGLNVALFAAGLLAAALGWCGIREQAAIGDTQFLRSMIPHHAGAILMCGKADLSRPDVQALCKEIIAGQNREIQQMSAMLEKQSR